VVDCLNSIAVSAARERQFANKNHQIAQANFCERRWQQRAFNFGCTAIG
jgi:hypothetical protein